MKNIIYLCIFVLISCSSNRNSLKEDINASLKMDYYTFPETTKILYKNKLYSERDFKQKYKITSFKEVEVIQDKEVITNITNDSTCKVILKIIR